MCNYIQKQNQIIEDIFNKVHKLFIKNNGYLYLNRSDENDCEGFQFEFYKDLNVIMYTEKIFEGYYHDDIIEVNPVLFKAETIEQAWEAIKESVKESIEVAVSDLFYDIKTYNSENFDTIINNTDWSFIYS